MNEGEKKKKVYKRGDIVTFRLAKRLKFSNDIIDFINESNKENTLNQEIVNALELYYKFKLYQSEVGITTQENFFRSISKNYESNLKEDISTSVKPKELEKEKENKVIEISSVNEQMDEQIIIKSNEDAADELFSDNNMKSKPQGVMKALGSLNRRK